MCHSRDNHSPIYEYRDYLKTKYGEVLHRVPLDVGMSCPHRLDNATGGCAFCPPDGARAVQLGKTVSIADQVRAGVDFARKRYNAKAFMAYLQAFTSTFASTTLLDHVVSAILAEQDFRAIAFGTRPDCLSPDVIRYLQHLNRRQDVWIELGVQTTHDQSLKLINRGHGWLTSRDAIIRLDNAGLMTAVHLIIGLPGETLDDYRATLKTLADLPVKAIKLHNLHVVEGTALAASYHDTPFPVFSEHEYAEILLELLPLLPPDIPIIRMTTDTAPEHLIAPRWSMSKGQFRTFLFDLMKKRGVHQGSSRNRPGSPSGENGAGSLPPAAVRTEDGSITFWNTDAKEHYHALAGARSEAERKYCQPGRLDQRLTRGKVRILDVCFGLGYNTLSSCEHALAADGEVEITGLEIDRTVIAAAAQQLQEQNSSFDWNRCLRALADDGTWQKNGCVVKLILGDARHTVRQLEPDFDLIWLDAFSTQKNSELWTIDFFSLLKSLLKPDGALLTYCAAIPVRSGLLQAGFLVGETPPFGRERGGTIAALSAQQLSLPLPERDQFLIQTVRGTPYRDPDGTRTNKEILRAREEEIVQRKKDPQNR